MDITTQTEEWRIVKDFPNYMVSSLGNVKNIKTKHILKPQHNKRGGDYLFVDLRYNGTRDCINIHNLVAQAFIGDRPDGCEIHHKDLNRSNCAKTNLEYKDGHTHKVDHAKNRRLNGDTVVLDEDNED